MWFGDGFVRLCRERESRRFSEKILVVNLKQRPGNKMVVRLLVCCWREMFHEEEFNHIFAGTHALPPRHDFRGTTIYDHPLTVLRTHSSVHSQRC